MSLSKMILNEWKFKAVDDREWLTAVVPGCVHTDLLRNEKISDPFYGTNERDLQWIDKKDWEYETHFQVTEELLAESHLNLVFDGLDTYADVYVNGKHILAADNMFREWTVDVKSVVQAQDNTIKIRFRSPIQEDLPKLEKLGYALPATNDQSDVGGLGDKKLSIFARKAPYHYGWDWGPRFVSSGIWREVRLEGWSEAQMNDLYIQQKEVSAASAFISAIVEIEAERAAQGVLKLSTEDASWEMKVQLQPGSNQVELEASLNAPKLWWCRGLGDAHMYTFHAEFLNEHKESVAAQSVKTGLRSLRWVKEKDTYGASFYVELNGIPVFSKGANHIPNDSFSTEVTYERYRHEIASAAAANMNMIRVWGGGIYEENMFYDLCDEYGLLVWQDFMFACSMYPGDEEFLESVKIEAQDNIKRLRNHPSIALWCGNNEIDGAWAQYNEHGGWGWKKDYTPEQREKLWADYEKIFHDILPAAVDQFAPGADYWPSSPMTGITDDIHQHATNTSTSGDIHYWGVWHAVEPFDNYNINIGRFMSEYGFQSFPEEKSVRTYAEDKDMELESEVMLAHQRNGNGNRLIKEYMDIYMKAAKDFPSFLYVSQVLQAEAMKMAIEAHRRRKSYCMGTLYWQVNDCWPVASWAGMDYFGRWKALQYYAKRSFKDVMLSIDATLGNHVDIHIVSDILEPVSGTLTLELLDFKGNTLKELSQPAAIGPNTAGRVCSLTVTELLEGCDSSEVVLVASLEQNGQIVDAKEHYFAAAKDLHLVKPDIQVTEVTGSKGTQFKLETDVLATQVWLSAETEGYFSDNFFDLIPGQPVTVQFFARESGDRAFAAASPGPLSVSSMADYVKL